MLALHHLVRCNQALVTKLAFSSIQPTSLITTRNRDQADRPSSRHTVLWKPQPCKRLRSSLPCHLDRRRVCRRS